MLGTNKRIDIWGVVGAAFMLLASMGGVQLVFEAGSPNSILYSVIIFIVLSKLITVQLGADDHGSAVFFVGIFAVFIFLSAPIWDEKNYCSKQTYAKTINVGAKSIADVINNKSRSDTYIYSGEKACLEDGGWEYSLGIQKLIVWVSGLAALLGIGFYAIYSGVIYLNNNADRFSWIFDRWYRNNDKPDDKPDDKPWELADFFNTTDTRRIKFISAILDRLKIEPRKGTRALIGDFEHWSPYNVAQLSDNQLSELKGLYVDLIEFIPSTYTEKEVKKGTLARRIKKLEDEVARIEAERQARGK